MRRDGMSPAGERKTQPTLGLLVIDALKKRASPEARAHILARAFKASGLTEMPEDQAELHWFVTGPLADAVARIVGTDPAEELIVELERQFREEGQRDSDVRPRESSPPAAEEELAATVLVVGDHDGMRQRLSMALRATHRVVTARDPLPALAIVIRHRPCCVVVDLRGEGAGAQLCAAIRTALGPASPPVVMLTDVVERPMGATPVRREPFDLGTLVRLVDEATG
jgi:CheY-like chemotaxis protein